MAGGRSNAAARPGLMIVSVESGHLAVSSRPCSITDQRHHLLLQAAASVETVGGHCASERKVSGHDGGTGLTEWIQGELRDHGILLMLVVRLPPPSSMTQIPPAPLDLELPRLAVQPGAGR